MRDSLKTERYVAYGQMLLDFVLSTIIDA